MLHPILLSLLCVVIMSFAFQSTSNKVFFTQRWSNVLRLPRKSAKDNNLRLKSTMSASPDYAPLVSMARDARGLAIDAVSKAKSGHLGLPLGCAEVGAALWGKHMQYNPQVPNWINRDRFVLSAGHGSMFLYSWLHLAGYDLSLDDIKSFRQLHSKTPGHPEFPSSSHSTPGIEATTGPLGAGIGNAVGMAAAAKMAAAKYNTEAHKIFDHDIIALCGDGCLQEGVSYEACAWAGHEKLDNLVLIYDSNEVTLDKMANFTQSEDVESRFRAIGWKTIVVEDGHNVQTIDEALTQSRIKSGKPTLIIVKTVIGKGIEQVQGKSAAHGESGVKFQREARQKLGLPDETFHVSSTTKDTFTKHQQVLESRYQNWTQNYEAWKAANPSKAQDLHNAVTKSYPTANELLSTIATQSSNDMASRQASYHVIQEISKHVPWFVSGAADLHSSTKNYLESAGDFGDSSMPGKSLLGKNLFFGIREHAMGTMLNGMAYYGLNIPSGATFLVFSDYLRPAIRIAALSELQVLYIFTHDSIAVGEDGPTHQPVETLSSLRLIPNLDVIRPADSEEVAGAYAAAIDRKNGPTALILSRQNLKSMNHLSVSERREGVLKGGYVVRKEQSELKLVLIATGSEVQLAMEVAEALGPHVRVVSMPCTERFDRQDGDYKNSVLPDSCQKRVAIEAGVPDLWYKYVGNKGVVIGVDRFGTSAPGETVLKEYGFEKNNVINRINSMNV